jgi:hypothetical protein
MGMRHDVPPCTDEIPLPALDTPPNTAEESCQGPNVAVTVPEIACLVELQRITRSFRQHLNIKFSNSKSRRHCLSAASVASINHLMADVEERELGLGRRVSLSQPLSQPLVMPLQQLQVEAASSQQGMLTEFSGCQQG